MKNIEWLGHQIQGNIEVLKKCQCFFFSLRWKLLAYPYWDESQVWHRGIKYCSFPLTTYD